MFGRKSIYLALIILALLALLLALSSTAFAKSYKFVAGTIQIGKQGIFVSAPGNRVVSLEVSKVKPPIPPLGVTLRAPTIKLSFRDSRNREVPAEGLVFIFFNLGPRERDLWDASGAKAVSIWVMNGSGIWKECPPMLIEAGDHGRLACLVSKNGTYGLGQKSYDPESYTKP